MDPWTGRVIGVKLRGLGLDGQVPAAFGRLPALRLLDLGGNELTGEIPPELGMLERLTHLDLDGNRLAGCIPGELERFDFDIGELSNPALRHCSGTG